MTTPTICNHSNSVCIKIHVHNVPAHTTFILLTRNTEIDLNTPLVTLESIVWGYAGKRQGCAILISIVFGLIQLQKKIKSNKGLLLRLRK